MFEEDGRVGLGEVVQVSEVGFDGVVVPTGGRVRPAERRVGHKVVGEDVEVHVFRIAVRDGELESVTVTVIETGRVVDERGLDAGTERAVEDVASSGDDGGTVDVVLLLIGDRHLHGETFGAVVDVRVVVANGAEVGSTKRLFIWVDVVADSRPGLLTVSRVASNLSAVDLGRLGRVHDNFFQTSLVEVAERHIGPEMVGRGIQVATFAVCLYAKRDARQGQDGRCQQRNSLDHFWDGKSRGEGVGDLAQRRST